MNVIHVIGNLTRDPEMRATQNGTAVCNFTVAVNRRRVEGQEQQADFFRVTAWRGLAEICAKYLAKGRKVAVTGEVSASAYKDNAGNPRAQIEINAHDVEFLSGKQETEQTVTQQTAPATVAPQFVQVDDDELPF